MTGGGILVAARRGLWVVPFEVLLAFLVISNAGSGDFAVCASTLTPFIVSTGKGPASDGRFWTVLLTDEIVVLLDGGSGLVDELCEIDPAEALSLMTVRPFVPASTRSCWCLRASSSMVIPFPLPLDFWPMRRVIFGVSEGLAELLIDIRSLTLG